jgi:colanic acid biosynthesis glycosyl transferase WcaI
VRTADVLIALLERDASEFSEPSKILTYLAAGRPILAAIPKTNQAAKTILEAGAGIVVDPDDTAGLVAGARKLLDDEAARLDASRRGHEYARRRFDIDRITERFERILAGSLRRGAAR